MARNTRKLPGAHVEWYTHPTTGMKGELRFAKSTMKFHGVINDEVFTDVDGTKVRKWIQTNTGIVHDLEWTPIIELHYDAPSTTTDYRRLSGGDDEDDKWEEVTEEAWEDESGSFNGRTFPPESCVEITVRATRYWIGRTRGGDWRRLDWDDYDAEISTGALLNRSDDFHQSEFDTDGPLALPIKSDRQRWDRSQEIFLRYNDATWAGITTLVGTLKAARKQLFTILESDTGIDSLTRLGGGGQLFFPPASTPDSEDRGI